MYAPPVFFAGTSGKSTEKNLLVEQKKKGDVTM